jgi:hypothetical protein
VRSLPHKKILVKYFFSLYISAMRESEVENYLVWKIETSGGKTFKFKSPSQRGVADRIVCMPNGETWFIELKRPKGGRLAPLQAIFRDEVVKLQQRYALLTNKKEIDEWTHEYLTRCSTE